MTKSRFVWHDLNTTDLEGSKKFYSEIFNWKLESGDKDPYIHISADGEMIGGMRKKEANEPGPSNWLGYIVVDDVAATVSSITGAGGRVYMPPTTIPTAGTFAVTADPTGAVFAPWKSARDGEDVEKQPMRKPFVFCWDELMSTDPAAAGAFYEKVFGWTLRPVDMGGGLIYTLLDRPGVKTPRGDQASAGGMMQSPPEMPASFWVAYVGVDSCDRVNERAAAMGATITVPPTDIPNIGRFASWFDPQGAAIAILQPSL
jgi:predicted enzyme related to lactoylglutathione lyase